MKRASQSFRINKRLAEHSGAGYLVASSLR